MKIDHLSSPEMLFDVFCPESITDKWTTYTNHKFYSKMQGKKGSRKKIGRLFQQRSFVDILGQDDTWSLSVTKNRDEVFLSGERPNKRKGFCVKIIWAKRSTTTQALSTLLWGAKSSDGITTEIY
mmetsp:Transcript_15387/g.17715  ORF Transcript_15387/g.17715 Transcript_15387/m.17715 type:complete len:125 (-) Transcript_15387:1284-1658(-)